MAYSRILDTIPTEASKQMMALIEALHNGNDPGTGIRQFSIFGYNLMGPTLPQNLLDTSLSSQNNLFGDYPKPKDVVPSAIFAAIFGVLMIVHLIIYSINCSRHHYFHLSLYWVFCCAMRVIGFIVRITWSYHIVNVDMGLADEVLLVIGSVVIVPSNLILAQRLFTWRHPVGGTRRLFTNTMFALYAIVLAVIALTIVTSLNPYIYYLSTKAFQSYKICVMISSVLIILYSLTAISLLALSYFFQPTRKDENLYTYQPWWIESFSPFYFVKKGAKLEAEETFMKRNHNHRHAIRVIAATHHHYNMVEGLTNERGALSHNTSILIVTVSTLFLFVSAIGRSIVVFQANKVSEQGPVANHIFMYVCWGALEAIIHMLFIFGRVDLRFYRPDRLPRKVRSIITAEQSVTLSRMVSNETSEDFDYLTDDEYQFNEQQARINTQHNERYLSAPPNYSDNSEEKDLDLDDSKDNESEFHF